MSSQDAGSAFQATEGTPWVRLNGTVYVSLGRPRVLVEGPGGRIDLSWEEWGDLVAGVGQRFVAIVLTRPDVLENVREAEQLAQLLARSAAAAPGERR